MSESNGRSRILTFAEYLEPARRLAKATGTPLSPIEVHRFPDGESRVRLPDRLPERVIVVRSLDHPNEKLVELMLTAEAARTLGAASLTLVAPYLCYMRQDTAFHSGEAVSQRIVGRFLAGLFDEIVTVDPHLHRTPDLGAVMPGTAARVLSATGPMAEFLMSALEDPILVGPDSESEQWVAAIARRAGCEFVVATKERTGDAEVRVTVPGHAFEGRNVVLVDDIVSTGSSLVAAAGALRPHAPRSLSALVTHGLFAEGAPSRLAEAGITRVWSTDSVPGSTSCISLDRLIAEALTA